MGDRHLGLQSLLLRLQHHDLPTAQFYWRQVPRVILKSRFIYYLSFSNRTSSDGSKPRGHVRPLFTLAHCWSVQAHVLPDRHNSTPVLLSRLNVVSASEVLLKILRHFSFVEPLACLPSLLLLFAGDAFSKQDVSFLAKQESLLYFNLAFSFIPSALAPLLVLALVSLVEVAGFGVNVL